MFKSTQNKGFQLKFANGFEISVQWGTMNYCSRKHDGDWNEAMNHECWESGTAEVAVFDNEGRMVNIGFNDEGVIGWVDTENIARIISVVQSSTTSNEIEKKIQSFIRK